MPRATLSPVSCPFVTRPCATRPFATRPFAPTSPLAYSRAISHSTLSLSHKILQLKSAVESACLLLRIDDILSGIKNKKYGDEGPSRKPAEEEEGGGGGGGGAEE